MFVLCITLYFQIKLACVKRKPLYLVEHEAHQEFVDVLTKYDKQLPNCAIVNFAGTLEELKKYVSMGFYIVIYGMCHTLLDTHPKSANHNFHRGHFSFF